MVALITFYNNFDEKIQVTFEVENSNSLLILDVLLIKKANAVDAKVYRKPMNNGVHFNKNAHAPATLKRETLKTILNQIHKVNF